MVVALLIIEVIVLVLTITIMNEWMDGGTVPRGGGGERLSNTREKWSSCSAKKKNPDNA